jgi:pyrroloquinoline quinone (PQQ) biosynthesis protein C
LGIDPSWVDGIAHPELYRRFLKSLGIHNIDKPDTCVSEWREALLHYLQTASQAEMIGAIGLGTESVVKHIYPYIIKSINSYTSLKLFDYVFFPLHTEVDDTHGEIILQITEDIIQQDEQQAALVRKGMLTALDLRSKYWDAMKSRAVRKRSTIYR